MLGVVAGDTDGIAPALELDLAWRRLAWYTEAEYLFDLDDRDDDFFYSWSTLTYGVTDWLSAGLVTERSKLVDTDYSLQRGLALELTRASLGFSLYAYNIGSDDFYAVVALGSRHERPSARAEDRAATGGRSRRTRSLRGRGGGRGARGALPARVLALDLHAGGARLGRGDRGLLRAAGTGTRWSSSGCT